MIDTSENFVYEVDQCLRAIKVYIPKQYLNEELPYTNMLVEGLRKLNNDYEVLQDIKDCLNLNQSNRS